MLTNDPLSSAPTLPTSEADPTHIRGCCHSAAAAWAREPKPLDEVFTLAASPAASLGALIDDALDLVLFLGHITKLTRARVTNLQHAAFQQRARTCPSAPHSDGNSQPLIMGQNRCLSTLSALIGKPS